VLTTQLLGPRSDVKCLDSETITLHIALDGKALRSSTAQLFKPRQPRAYNAAHVLGAAVPDRACHDTVVVGWSRAGSSQAGRRAICVYLATPTAEQRGRMGLERARSNRGRGSRQQGQREQEEEEEEEEGEQEVAPAAAQPNPGHPAPAPAPHGPHPQQHQGGQQQGQGLGVGGAAPAAAAAAAAHVNPAPADVFEALAEAVQGARAACSGETQQHLAVLEGLRAAIHCCMEAAGGGLAQRASLPMEALNHMTLDQLVLFCAAHVKSAQRRAGEGDAQGAAEYLLEQLGAAGARVKPQPPQQA
jgi:hypothetical protein